MHSLLRKALSRGHSTMRISVSMCVTDTVKSPAQNSLKDPTATDG